jgi:hypothetical protein
VTELDSELTLADAAENPELLAAANALTDEEKQPEIEDPLDGPVTLPGGFRRVQSGSEGTKVEDVRSAWVKELTGEDEERIARAKLKDDLNAFLIAVLESGVQRLGETTPTRDDFNSLLTGDRDFLLMEIARVTYGDEIEYEDFICPTCGETFNVALSISEDIPITRLKGVEDSGFEVKLRKDRVASVVLPTIEVSSMTANAKTSAEVNTILVAHCVEEIRGPKGITQINGNVEAARQLGIADRQKLVNEMGKRMPGPQYNKVRFDHEPGCGEEVRLTVTMADLFRGM